MFGAQGRGQRNARGSGASAADARRLARTLCVAVLGVAFPVLFAGCDSSGGQPAGTAAGAAKDTPALTRSVAPTSPTASPVPRPPVAAANHGQGQVTVPSTAAHYYVLYVRPDLNSEAEYTVSMTRGKDGRTTLTEGLAALPAAHYRVEEHRIDSPADTDGDAIDDMAELAEPARLNPLNPAPPVDFRDGAVAIPDRATFQELSYQGQDVRIDTHLADLEFVKFYLLGMDTDRPSVYFMNTKTHRAHFGFAEAVGIPGGRRGGGPGTPPGQPGGPGGPGANAPGQMRGEIVFHPNVIAPDGDLGVYRFEFEPNDAYPFSEVTRGYELLAASMPLLTNNLAYYPMPARALPLYRREKALYDDSRIHIVLDDDIFPDVAFIPLNAAEGYGLLRLMSVEQSPGPRDVVIYEALPNDLPRVGGMITTVPQGPLSHVNLRAVQDGVPNAFVRDALDDPAITGLIGRYVHYTVDSTGWSVRQATPAEVNEHYLSIRPAAPQVPERDLSLREIRPLAQVAFDDWTAFGVKAANLATLGTFGFPAGTVPDGFAVPFSFYDEFMRFNGFYEEVEAMLASAEFRSDFAGQETRLAELREAIKDAPMPRWVMEDLKTLQDSFPAGTAIRCRSSTNNEDLPGFSGAGLYESKTQHPDEGHLSKCIKQVYASLWSFRAFTEREFHRIDHLVTAMGVLAHANFSDERANGVAVTVDPAYATSNSYYVHSQVGEDLVTNPWASSVPEEILLGRDGGYEVVRRSNRLPAGESAMTAAQLDDLRTYLGVIHARFAALYRVAPGEEFAMEVEFKVTSDGRVAIKQARPWVFR